MAKITLEIDTDSNRDISRAFHMLRGLYETSFQEVEVILKRRKPEGGEENANTNSEYKS